MICPLGLECPSQDCENKEECEEVYEELIKPIRLPYEYDLEKKCLTVFTYEGDIEGFAAAEVLPYEYDLETKTLDVWSNSRTYYGFVIALGLWQKTGTINLLK